MSSSAGCSSLALLVDGKHRTIDPHALKIPARRAEYSLTENAASPFHAEPRQILCTLVILWLSIPHASAQSGVLIGLHVYSGDDGNGQQQPSYRTLLITFRDGTAQLAADLPDLIVPRKDGFWRVGTLHKGPPGKYMGQEFVNAVPARSVPHAVGEYHPENPDWNCSETDQATIEFVNPELLSVSYFTEPACSLEEKHQHGTYKLDEFEKELDIAAVLGAAAWGAEKRADAAAKADKDISPDCLGISKPDPTNWGIERYNRAPGHVAKAWVLVSDFDAPHVCHDGETYVIKFPFQNLSPGPPTTPIPWCRFYNPSGQRITTWFPPRLSSVSLATSFWISVTA
jgi:hypothetical protein